ncbi:MAG: tRNA (N(6)-L-threonylcarbamoyladenosine(37)-C(2))-methylthiotransferase MtaB [Lachnospiraceae bacterium]
MRRAAFHNLGCKVNAYETESMEQMLSNAGYEIVDFEKDVADVYVINTCSVTNIADRKSRQMLHRARKMNPQAIVIAAGCYAQGAAEEILSDGAVDIVVGNNRKLDILAIIEAYEKDHGRNQDLLDIGKEQEYEELKINRVVERTRAFIKVQDGCNQFCTYCIIPYVRGRIRSRKVSDVLDEVRTLVSAGYKEVVLTGIHLSSYGMEKDAKEDTSLIELIEAVSRVEGVKRIRLGSLEPRIVTEEFVQRIAAIPQMCPHFHLSLQSGCDTTLKRMNRRYDTAEYTLGCEILRKYFDHPAITTDVIVGFPQETAEEFETTVKFLKAIHFFEMHVFKYSRRKGTVADRMEGQVDERVKSERSDVLLELERQMSDEYRKNLIGTTTEVLFEEKVTINDREYYVGHTRTYVRVAVESAENLENEIVPVLVTAHLLGDTMFGTMG